ncbi:unnamed protein product [Choristocarpus tenellus]
MLLVSNGIAESTSETLSHLSTRRVVEFGNSPLVCQHLRDLRDRGHIMLATRLQVTGQATRSIRPFQDTIFDDPGDRSLRRNTQRAAQVKASLSVM